MDGLVLVCFFNSMCSNTCYGVYRGILFVCVLGIPWAVCEVGTHAKGRALLVPCSGLASLSETHNPVCAHREVRLISFQKMELLGIIGTCP